MKPIPMSELEFVFHIIMPLYTLLNLKITKAAKKQLLFGYVKKIYIKVFFPLVFFFCFFFLNFIFPVSLRSSLLNALTSIFVLSLVD